MVDLGHFESLDTALFRQFKKNTTDNKKDGLDHGQKIKKKMTFFIKKIQRGKRNWIEK